MVVSREIIKVATELLQQPIIKVRKMALEYLSCIFVSNNPQLVSWSIEQGIYTSIKEILESHQKVDLIHACLFCLSNIAAGSKEQVKRLIEEEIIINLVMQHANSPKLIVAGESMWVLCNIVSSAKPEDRLNFLRIYSSDLVHVLIHWIEHNASRAGEARLTLEVLDALMKLL